MHSKTKRIVITALMAAMVCVATMIIKIPSPMKGYLNIGDCIVLLCGWLLSPGYGFVAAGLGSALADMFSGYITYAPATFLIKGSMALIAFACFKLMNKRLGRLPSQIIGAVLAEIVMVFGYFVFEGFMYGFVPSAVNIPANAVQGAAGLILGIILVKVFERLKITLD
mgnify:FL=1